MEIPVYWYELRSRRNSLWQGSRCLYAYFHPESDLLLYVGQAERLTVEQRFYGPDKHQGLYAYIREEFKIDPHQLRVFAGLIDLPEGRRLSKALIDDVESLLIKRLQPYGNIKATKSRISRRGMLVLCLGDWLHSKTAFHDR